MWATPTKVIDGYIFPAGAYASEIPPWSAEYTQRSLAKLFYGTEGKIVNTFVLLDGEDFMYLFYPEYPHQWVKPSVSGYPAPVTVLMTGPNLMLP